MPFIEGKEGESISEKRPSTSLEVFQERQLLYITQLSQRVKLLGKKFSERAEGFIDRNWSELAVRYSPTIGYAVGVSAGVLFGEAQIAEVVDIGLSDGLPQAANSFRVLNTFLIALPMTGVLGSVIGEYLGMRVRSGDLKSVYVI